MQLRILYILATILAASTLQSCFTGVESTRRITSRDVRRQQASGQSPEQMFLADIAPLPPHRWEPGRRFKVSESRVGLIFTSASSPSENLAGKDLIFCSFEPARSLTGDDACDVVLGSEDGGTYFYRIANTVAEVDTLASLMIPFTVDKTLVEEVDRRLRGQNYYVITPAWLSKDDFQRADNPLHHVRVVVDSVAPGTDTYPCAVYFRVDDSLVEGYSAEYVLLMTLGSSKAATRNFDTLFTFSNPRDTYPEIKKETWEKIIRSEVISGMSREECRLALGSPPQVQRIPTYGGMVERWIYTDGIYLVFEDGYLTSFRQ